MIGFLRQTGLIHCRHCRFPFSHWSLWSTYICTVLGRSFVMTSTVICPLWFVICDVWSVTPAASVIWRMTVCFLTWEVWGATLFGLSIVLHARRLSLCSTFLFTLPHPKHTAGVLKSWVPPRRMPTTILFRNVVEGDSVQVIASTSADPKGVRKDNFDYLRWFCQMWPRYCPYFFVAHCRGRFPGTDCASHIAHGFIGEEYTYVSCDGVNRI